MAIELSRFDSVLGFEDRIRLQSPSGAAPVSEIVLDPITERIRQSLPAPVIDRPGPVPAPRLEPTNVGFVLHVVGDEQAVRQGLITSPKVSNLQAAATGSGIGAAVGSVVPGIGNVVGGFVGGVGGFVGGLLSRDTKTPLFEKYNENIFSLLMKGNPGIMISSIDRGARGIKFFRIDTELPEEGMAALIREVNQQWLASVAQISDRDDRADIRAAIPTIRITATPRPGELKLFSFNALATATQTAQAVGAAQSSTPDQVAAGNGPPDGLKAAGLVGAVLLLTQLGG